MLHTAFVHHFAAARPSFWRLLWWACAMSVGQGVLEQVRLPPANSATACARTHRLARYARISAW